MFATGEEQALEGASRLGGNDRHDPVGALAEAGTRVETIANRHPNVVVDRALITGLGSALDALPQLVIEDAAIR